MPDLPVSSAAQLSLGKLNDVAIAILGGDNRERRLVTGLLASGYRVICVGRDLSAVETAAGAEAAEPADAFRLACAVVGPMAGIGPDGMVWSREPHPGAVVRPWMLELLPDGAPWMSGKVHGELADALGRTGLEFIDLSDHDVLAVLNAVPSAEGATMMAMKESPFCLHSSESLVVGFGRTGQAMAMVLHGLRSRVTVVARSKAARARAYAMGYGAAGFAELGELIKTAQFCFNTVPAPVLTEPILQMADRDMLVIDLASRPGGTDFAAAERLGVKAILAPGLPGIVAPRTAGEYLTQVILETLKERGL